MDGTSVHLILNHAPVFFVLSGIPLLLYGYVRKQTQLTYLGLGFFVLAALFALPVYFSGEQAEETVEHLPGVLESLIKDHEEMAERALFFMETLGLSALLGGASLYYNWAMKRFLLPVIMVLSVVAGAFIVQTAHLGGQIRHTEIRSGSESDESHKEYKDHDKDKDKDRD